MSTSSSLTSESVDPPPRATPAIAKLASTLGRTYRVTVQDGRVFVGIFVCIDHDGNLVLDRTSEFEPRGTKAGERAVLDPMYKGRLVGLVLVPRKQWAKVEIEDMAEDEERSSSTCAVS